ncbi:carboxypeptidase-like regulatory domain-containing protein [Porphyromonas macacae]|uniref:carboxypeptidase-like regulatory domain-containing protein n=1 Tax=Porphyromonas macacae TaxID=28115 RepID=UPI000687B46A|nr:carboxypeptidase-like regulatory domain-containing protein [Porphyromonas macacae]
MKSSLHVRFLASLFLLLFPLWAMAQATLSGRVMDEEKKPLSMASVKLFNSQGEMVYGTATDNNGYFSLKNVKNNQYSLSISYVGLTEYTQAVRVGNADQKLKTITLKEGMGKLLNNVTVTAKAAEVVINNDTLEYNAGSYNLQTGAALEDSSKSYPEQK